LTLPYASPGDPSITEISEPLPRIALPPKLFVPVPRVNDNAVAAKPSGTHVRRGESLLATDSTDGVAVLAPADGKLGEVISKTLTNGKSIDAVELLTDPSTFARSAPHFEHPATDFPEFVQQLQHGAVQANRCVSPTCTSSFAAR
jgi:hypothetical protein